MRKKRGMRKERGTKGKTEEERGSGRREGGMASRKRGDKKGGGRKDETKEERR